MIGEPHKCTELAWADPGTYCCPGTLDYIGAAMANLSQGTPLLRQDGPSRNPAEHASQHASAALDTLMRG